MTSGSPLAGSEPRLCWICGPITGYWETAELTRLACSEGSFLSTRFSTVTRMSSSGKRAAKA